MRAQNVKTMSLGSKFCVPCSDTEHGGNIYKLAEELEVPEDEIIDFSASINPLGISRKVKNVIRKELNCLVHYPDPEAALLREEIGQYHGIDPATIICGNGSTELIHLIARALKPEKVLIPMPTFSEYERACKIARNKLQVASYKLRKENNFAINPDEFISLIKISTGSKSNSSLSVNMAFLCNPNNPTGDLLKQEDVLRIANVAKEMKYYLVIDEAFIDFCPEESVIEAVQYNPYLIVLRSMTKFYALSGLRIGYGVFPLSLIERINRFKEPWTLNTLAQKAAIAILKDKDYPQQTFKLIKREKDFLERGFKKIGIEFYPSKANFYLLKIPSLNNTLTELRKKGILVRDCSNFKGLGNSYIRVAVKSRGHNKILLKELSRLCAV